jgi:lysozyme family protein
MPTVSFSESLRNEYENLFNTCVIRSERVQAVDALVAKLQANKTRYQNVSATLGIPWGFVAVIHNMEASLNFTKHLHSGDPPASTPAQCDTARRSLLYAQIDRLRGRGTCRRAPTVAQHLPRSLC